MPKKSKPSPKVKHKPFASFCTRLQDDDWMIGVFNPNDKTASYFLAEPIAPNPSEAQQLKTKKASGGSFIVSALSRQDLVENTIKGLPRKFKTVEDAMEWLEGQVEDYEGDKVVEFRDSISTGRTSCSGPGRDITENIPRNQVEEGKIPTNTYKATTGAKPVARVKTDKPKVNPRGKNGTISTKTAKSDDPYVKPVNKFKTSKQELESLGLGDLFDD